jgi:hypothetical protein
MLVLRGDTVAKGLYAREVTFVCNNDDIVKVEQYIKHNSTRIPANRTVSKSLALP